MCPSQRELLAAGPLLTATMTLDEDVSVPDTVDSYIYALVLDSDGDPGNDWQALPAYPFDLFKAADRWYQLIWDHGQLAWSMTVTQVAADQSTTRVTRAPGP